MKGHQLVDRESYPASASSIGQRASGNPLNVLLRAAFKSSEYGRLLPHKYLSLLLCQRWIILSPSLLATPNLLFPLRPFSFSPDFALLFFFYRSFTVLVNIYQFVYTRDGSFNRLRLLGILYQPISSLRLSFPPASAFSALLFL